MNPTKDKVSNPVIEADAAGTFHVFPVPDDEYPELAHEVSPFCWCFAEPRWVDEKGQRMKAPVYTHHVFAHRGNA